MTRPKGRDPLEMRVEAELDPDHVLCPFCASAYVIDDAAGRRYGACTACYRRALAEAARDEMRGLEAAREYDAERQRLHRMREERGLGPAGKGKGREPRF